MIKTILDLCGGTGAWSAPYREAGYNVIVIDAKNGQDVRLLKPFPYPVRGILAAPPCTHLAGSGARWWEEKGESALLESLSIVDACLRAVVLCRPNWWALENPVGRLSRYLGPPAITFDPCDFGGWPGGDGDNYTKKTCLWGDFTPPEIRRIRPTDGSRMHRMPPTDNRWELRSMTPTGFARAFFEANP